MAAHTITRTEGFDRDSGVHLECSCGWSTHVLDPDRAHEVMVSHLERQPVGRAAAEEHLADQIDGHQRTDL